MTLSPESSTAVAGTASSKQLTATIAPANATNQGVTYAIAPTTSGLSVSQEGLIEWTNAVGAGVYTTTVTSEDGTFTDTHVLTLTEPHTVTFMLTDEVSMDNTKAEIEACLDKYGVSYSTSDTKAELLELLIVGVITVNGNIDSSILPADPIRSEYVFHHWYKTNVYDWINFDEPIMSDVIYYAYFTFDESDEKWTTKDDYGINGRFLMDDDGNGVVYNLDGGSELMNNANSFSAYPSIKTLRFVDKTLFENCMNMFEGCANLISVNFDNVKIDETVSGMLLNGMFKDCTSLSTLDLSNLNLNNIFGTSSMFNGCTNLTTLKFSNLNLSSVWDTMDMFKNCLSLTDVTFENVTPTYLIPSTNFVLNVPTDVANQLKATLFVSE